MTKHITITQRYKAPYSSRLWGNRPMTLGRLLNEAPYTPEQLEEKEAKRRKFLAILMSKKDGSKKAKKSQVTEFFG